MKKNDWLQIKALDLKELKTKSLAIKTEIANIVMDKNMKKLKDLKTILKKKKELAQVLTIMKQKQQLIQLETKKGEELRSSKSI